MKFKILLCLDNNNDNDNRDVFFVLCLFDRYLCENHFFHLGRNLMFLTIWGEFEILYCECKEQVEVVINC